MPERLIYRRIQRSELAMHEQMSESAAGSVSR